MKAVVFEYKLRKLALSSILGAFTPKGYFTRLGHMKLKTIPDPHLFGDDWVIIRTEYCGICGSDFKQAFLIGNKDNPITALISFPNVLGHEVVGIIEKAGPKSRGSKRETESRFTRIFAAFLARLNLVK